MTDEIQVTKRPASPSGVKKPDQAPRARGRPIGDRGAKRAQLLQAALAVIAEEGYGAASLRRVAQRAGCTTGQITYYFSSREEMMAAALENRFDLFDELAGNEPGAAGVRKGFQRWLDWASAEDPQERLAGFQLIAYARHEPALAVVYQRRYALYRDRLAAVLARGQQERTVRSDIPAEVLSDQLCAMGDGWMMSLPVEPERFGSAWVKTLVDSTMTLIAPPSDDRQADKPPRQPRRTKRKPSSARATAADRRRAKATRPT